MLNILRRITAIAVAISTVGSVVAFAEEENTEVKTESEVTEETLEEKVYELSLSGAINLALTDNPSLAANDATIKSAELSLEVSKEAMKDYKDMEDAYSKIPQLSMRIAINPANGLESAYLKHGYYTSAAQVALELAPLEKEKNIAAISFDVTQKYYNVKLMEKLLEIGEASLVIATENAEIVKKNYELGYVSQLEVKNAEAAVKSAEATCEANKRNMIIATESLKIALGIDEESCQIVLTDEMPSVQMPLNAEEKIEEAMKTRYDVTALDKNLYLAEIYFEITDKYVSDSTASYHSAYSSYLSTKQSCENSKKMIKLSLKNDYFSILTTKDEVDSAQKALEIKTIEYESTKIKYEMGMVTNLELTSKMTELEGCKMQLENKRLAYLMAVLRFEYNTTIGI